MGEEGGKGTLYPKTPQFTPKSRSGKISYYTQPPKRDEVGVQLEAQILASMGPALDLEALERGDAEALAGENLGFVSPEIGPLLTSTVLSWCCCSDPGGGDGY